MRTRRSSEMLKGAFVCLWACSMFALFFYVNYLMLYRPNAPVSVLGFIYQFPGKGRPVFVSMHDYAIVCGSVATMITSMFGANYFHRLLR